MFWPGWRPVNNFVRTTLYNLFMYTNCINSLYFSTQNKAYLVLYSIRIRTWDCRMEREYKTNERSAVFRIKLQMNKFILSVLVL